MQKGVDYPALTVTFFCHDGEGNIVFAKRGTNCRDEHGRWDIGGGGVDFGVSAVDTLKREISEEYKTDVLNYEFLGYRDVFRVQNGKPTHWLSLDFKVLVDRNKVANGEPHKFDDVRWFRLESLPEPVHSQFPPFLELYKNRL